MESADGRYVICYNGEIYNFAELRSELIAAGCSFKTRSDTEVLLQGFARWGQALFSRLDGIFAFAIWDRRDRALTCVRDRVGTKPFFYASGPDLKGGFVFASTLAPFLELEGVTRRLDFEAVRDYLAFQTVLAPHSFVRGVRQLPPAHCLVWRQGGEPRLERYWSIPNGGPSRVRSRDEAVEATAAAVAESVRRQLVSDVPIGVFLSGGIDSSLVVHYMAQAGARPIRTFSVRFPGYEFDESDAARTVATRYGTEHHIFDSQEISGATWLELIGTLDQPLADPAFVPLAALSRLTRKEVAVVLSGDGGDELFGGYGRFLEGEERYPASPWQRLLGTLIDRGLAPAALRRRSLSGRALVDYRKVELGNFPGTRKDIGKYLQRDALAAAHPEQTLQRWHDLIDEFGGRATTQAMMRADVWSYLSENCLTKTDRASMAFGLEARVPLLGNPVLELALDMPASIHFDPKGKALLRALAKKHLPEAVWGREKQGFSVPLSRYFNGAWKEAGDDLVARCRTLAPWLQADAVSRLWRDARRESASRRLMYTFLVLLAWLDRNGNRVSA
jgi:asparagine synthase (glutamine-hydrolysing)